MDSGGHSPWQRLAPVLLALLLFLLVFALFSPSLRYELVDFDDITYVANNTAVHEGLSAASIRPAFSLHNPTATMYMPLLWISFMADAEWLGATPSRPWGFHFTNVLLHSANAALLFFMLLAMCKTPWRAFFFAALWAFHPLRAESVAWVTERKDVLSGFFAFLCLLCYLRAAAGGRRGFWATGAALLFFACALLVKPALAPLPLAMLLLDYWPGARLGTTLREARQILPRILLGIAPFILLGALAAYGTVLTHHNVSGDIPRSFPLRLLAVPLAYVFYLGKIILPRNLTPLYSPFESWARPNVFGAYSLLAAGLVLALTALIWRRRERRPNALTGWVWFLGMMFPVSGIIPIPMNDVADRFTYFPATGLSVALLFYQPYFLRKRGWLRTALAGGPLVFLAWLTCVQLPAWANTQAFYDRVLAVYPRHATALRARAGQLIRDTGDFAQADELVSRALQSEPLHWGAHFVKAQCLAELEGPAAALWHMQQIAPPTSQYAYVDWCRDCARYALMLGQHALALEYADRALERLPTHDLSAVPTLMIAMAAAYEKGDQELALAYAHRFPPYSNKTSLELADLLPHYVFQWVGGYRRDAVAYFRRLAAACLDQPDILNNVAWGLATAAWSPADPQEVLAWATRLSALVPTPNPGILDTLAAAQANAGDFASAVHTLEKALALLPGGNDPALLLFKERLSARLALYRQNCPYREEALTRMYETYFGPLSRLRDPQNP